MKPILKASRLALAAIGFAVAGAASAGPIVIAGTDADDHGSVVGGVNQNGWKFMQQVFTNLGGKVGNGNMSIVCLGCNGSKASAAFTSATSLAGLVGWTATTLTAVSDISNFFSGVGAVNIKNTGIVYMPTVASNVGGGITDAQLAPVNANGATINKYLTAGGGLFTQEEANSTIGYGWLTSLLPGLIIKGDRHGGISNATALFLTPQGQLEFPTLTNADISRATPWHAYFKGGFGSLQSLVVGNGDNMPVGAFDDTVVLGGSTQGGGIVGEPETLPLLLIAACGFFLSRRRRAS